MAWHVVTDPDGVNHDLCFQVLENSCGAACVAMSVRKVKNKLCDESTARAALNKYANTAGSGASKVLSYEETGYDAWKNVGFNPSGVAQGLCDLGCKDAKSKWSTDADLTTTLGRKCTKNKPGIAFVYWNAGGGHAVLCIGYDDAQANVLFLDPSHQGVVSIPVGSLPTYTAPTGVGTVANMVVLSAW